MTTNENIYDEQHVTRDAAHVRFHDDADGITVDSDGEPSFDWDEVERVTIEDPPHAEAFDSKEFYKIPATVAKPIPQPYQYGEDTVWLKKPREELKKAAWSLDNAPWTLGHPDNGAMVKDVGDVHGFWRNPRYIDSLDDLDANLHLPVGDEEARDFLEDNSDVSVGFYNRIARRDDYDGVVGGADDSDAPEIEGYQTDMLFDHVASVGMGRCPAEKGCGIAADSATAEEATHGHVEPIADAFKSGTRIMNGSDEGEGTDSGMETTPTTDAPSGIYTADGKWFAVGPDEHGDDSTDYADDAKYPVDSCEDIKDAWNLRGSGDISISKDTLAERIRRAAEAKDCTLPEEDSVTDAMVAESAKNYSICGSRIEVMDDRYGCPDGDCGGANGGGDADNNDNDNDNFTMEISFDDLSAEAALVKVSDQNEAVEERLEELRSAEDAAEVAEEAAEELELDDVSELTDTAAMLKEQNEKLRERVDELERPAMEEDAEFIAENTDRFGEDAEEVIENLDEDADEVADKRELVEELTEEYDETTANSGGDDGGSEDENPITADGGYAKTPW